MYLLYTSYLLVGIFIAENKDIVRNSKIIPTTNGKDVVVAECASVFQLLSGKDQSLLVRGDSLLVLDLGLDVVDGVGWCDIEGDGLTREGLPSG